MDLCSSLQFRRLKNSITLLYLTGVYMCEQVYWRGKELWGLRWLQVLEGDSLLQYRPMLDSTKRLPEPKPTVTSLGVADWDISAHGGPMNKAETLPERFEEVLRATRASVGQDGFAYDGTITVATSLRLDPSTKSVTIELSPQPYSCILASRRYGEIHGFHKAPYRPAISSVLVRTKDDLWILGQRSTSVDISKGKAGFSAGGFVDPELLTEDPEQRDSFKLAVLRELEEELGVEDQDLVFLCPNVLITSWRKVEISYLATTALSLEQVRDRAASADGKDEHQRILGVLPNEYPTILNRYGTWPGVREALAQALQLA